MPDPKSANAQPGPDTNCASLGDLQGSWIRSSTSGSWQSRSSTSVPTAMDGTLPSLPEPLDANSLCKPSRENVESTPGSVYTLENNAFPLYNFYKDNVTSISEASPVHQAVPLESNSVGAMGVRVGTRAPQAKSINKVEKTLEKNRRAQAKFRDKQKQKEKDMQLQLEALQSQFESVHVETVSLRHQNEVRDSF